MFKPMISRTPLIPLPNFTILASKPRYVTILEGRIFWSPKASHENGSGQQGSDCFNGYMSNCTGEKCPTPKHNMVSKMVEMIRDGFQSLHLHISSRLTRATIQS